MIEKLFSADEDLSREVMAIRYRKFMVFYGRESVFDALRISLPLKSTIDTRSSATTRCVWEAHTGADRADGSPISTKSEDHFSVMVYRRTLARARDLSMFARVVHPL